MKKSKKQNIIILSIVIPLIVLVVGYNYSIEQIKQKGLKFGNEIQQIQDELKQTQTEFSSKVKQLEEGDLRLDEFLEYSGVHLQKLQIIITKYDNLLPPQPFESAVELFKLSSQAQLDSDEEYIKWIDTKEEAHKIRSNSILQEAFEYELLALTEFNAAKAGLR